VVQQAIKVMQQKLAAVLQELAGDENGNGDIDGDGFGGQEPDLQGGADYGADQGYTTPYVNAGATSQWGGGATPYGATPYGQSGWNQ
jgi:DNA-directed RNA polymerase II subunit RPB3